MGLVLLTTLKHSAFSYLEITPVKFDNLWLDWAYSLLVVLVLDAAILYASYRGRIDLARIAAVTVGALSLAAFWSTDEEFTLTQWVAVVAFSVIIPYLQYELAEIFAADLHRADDYLLRGQRITELEGERETLIKRVGVVEAALRVQDTQVVAAETARDAALRDAQDADAARRIAEARELEFTNRMDQAVKDRDEAVRARNNAERERDALKADLVAMTGARDTALSQRDNWKATAKPLEPYNSLRYALESGPVTLGRNQILLPEPITTAKGIYVPFQVVNNNDPRLKKTQEDLADSE